MELDSIRFVPIFINLNSLTLYNYEYEWDICIPSLLLDFFQEAVNPNITIIRSLFFFFFPIKKRYEKLGSWVLFLC